MNISPTGAWDHPAVRVLLPCAFSISFFLLVIVSLAGIEPLVSTWKKANPDIQLLIFVVLGASVLVWIFQILAVPSADSLWTGTPLRTTHSKRFSSLINGDFYEDYPETHYGIDATVLWPRLYLILPEHARKQVGEARSNLLLAEAFSKIFDSLFSLLCPVWCGVLLHIGYTTKEWFWPSLIVTLLTVFYFIIPCVTALRVLGRVGFVTSVITWLTPRTYLKYIFLMACGWIILQCATCPLLESIVHNNTAWNPGLLRLVTCTFEIFCLGLVADLCQAWLLKSGTTYGELSCSVFDVYRKQLGEHFSFPSNLSIIDERKHWTIQSQFLRSGLVLGQRKKASDRVSLLKKLIPENVFTNFIHAFLEDFASLLDLYTMTALREEEREKSPGFWERSKRLLSNTSYQCIAIVGRIFLLSEIVFPSILHSHAAPITSAERILFSSICILTAPIWACLYFGYAKLFLLSAQKLNLFQKLPNPLYRFWYASFSFTAFSVYTAIVYFDYRLVFDVQFWNVIVFVFLWATIAVGIRWDIYCLKRTKAQVFSKSGKFINTKKRKKVRKNADIRDERDEGKIENSESSAAKEKEPSVQEKAEQALSQNEEA